MLMLGIETSCDETSAAVVSRTRTAAGRSARTSSRRRWPSTASGAASCPSWRRASTSATSAASCARALEHGERRACPTSMRSPSRRARAWSARCWSACRSPSRWRCRSSRRSCRCTTSPATSSRCFCSTARIPLPLVGARRVGRPHQPLRGDGRPARTGASAARATMRRARPTTRWRSCWASAIRAGRSSTSCARQGNDEAVDLPATRMTHADRNAPDDEGRSGFQLQRLEDGGAAPRASVRPAGPSDDRPRDRRHLRQLPARRRDDAARPTVRGGRAIRRASVGIAGGVSANSRLRKRSCRAQRRMGLPVLRARTSRCRPTTRR